ncbi:MAG: nucleotidyltransferase domain-containing protein [Thermodesulfobacteriota bacterium]
MSNARRQQRATGSNIMADLADFFASEPLVLFAYLFGSQARGVTGPLSDLDLAVYLDGRVDLFATRLRLMASLAKRIRTEKFDLVVLNEASPVLRYEVVKGGLVLKESKARRVLFETEAMRSYLDTAPLRAVQRQCLKRSLQKEYGGERHG